jgi:type I restriction enzyme M protein
MSTDSERREVHRTIWRIANDLRGSVDGWDFKGYVLGMLFYRYISENLTRYLNKQEHEAGFEDFDYAKLSDEDAEVAREVTVEEKGFFIRPGLCQES